jgi:hypothetical protein
MGRDGARDVFRKSLIRLNVQSENFFAVCLADLFDANDFGAQRVFAHFANPFVDGAVARDLVMSLGMAWGVKIFACRLWI